MRAAASLRQMREQRAAEAKARTAAALIERDASLRTALVAALSRRRVLRAQLASLGRNVERGGSELASVLKRNTQTRRWGSPVS